MKKICYVLLSLILSVSTFFSSACAESDSSTIFEPLLLTVIDTSASEWYESSINRSLFAAVATMDIVLEFDDQYVPQTSTAYANETVYVAKSGELLILFFFGNDDAILLLYSPQINEAEISSGKSSTSSVLIESLMDGLVESDAIDSYYPVDTEAAAELALEIVNLLPE